MQPGEKSQIKSLSETTVLNVWFRSKTNARKFSGLVGEGLLTDFFVFSRTRGISENLNHYHQDLKLE